MNLINGNLLAKASQTLYILTASELHSQWSCCMLMMMVFEKFHLKFSRTAADYSRFGKFSTQK